VGQLTPWKTVLIQGLACYNRLTVTLPQISVCRVLEYQGTLMINETKIMASGLLVSVAAFIIIVAGMKAAAPLLVPFLLALFVAILIASPFNWLQDKGLPAGVALLVVLGLLVLMILLLGTLIGSSVEDFTGDFPDFQKRLHAVMGGLLAWLDKAGIHVTNELMSAYMDPGKAMQMATNILGGMGNMLTNSFLILVTVVFIMLEAAGFPDKWRLMRSNADESLAEFSEMIKNINRYMGIKTLTSLATGVLVVVLLVILGVDYPLLWGVLAFLLNFVPNIGSIIAAIPAVLQTLVQFGFGTALEVGLGYLAINIVIGTVIEPRYMGKGLGLSTLVVFLSLVFWGWVLGPVGMLLSVPLTIAAKIALTGHENTHWVAIMLGPKVEPVPAVEPPLPDTDSAV
jgi:AI-2 transport protein TqsA